MAEAVSLLGSRQVAEFVARGFLRLEAVVPDALNQRFCADAEQRAIPEVPAGTPLLAAYPADSTLGAIVRLPLVRGAIESLAGPGCLLDHHFLHIAHKRSSFEKRGLRQSSQPTHQDSTIDPSREHFDVQLLYFPQEVTRDMGGTRIIPGSHLRVVSEAAVGRYQNILGQEPVVCPAGTLLVAHHGLWHGGGINRSERIRYMFKLRLNPTVKQCRLWDVSDLPADHRTQRAIFWLREPPDPDHLHSILCRLEPWYEQDSGRLEILNRIRLWRSLLGEPDFDADYWLSRLENRPA